MIIPIAQDTAFMQNVAAWLRAGKDVPFLPIDHRMSNLNYWDVHIPPNAWHMACAFDPEPTK